MRSSNCLDYYLRPRSNCLFFYRLGIGRNHIGYINRMVRVFNRIKNKQMKTVAITTANLLFLLALYFCWYALQAPDLLHTLLAAVFGVAMLLHMPWKMIWHNHLPIMVCLGGLVILLIILFLCTITHQWLPTFMTFTTFFAFHSMNTLFLEMFKELEKLHEKSTNK